MSDEAGAARALMVLVAVAERAIDAMEALELLPTETSSRPPSACATSRWSSCASAAFGRTLSTTSATIGLTRTADTHTPRSSVDLAPRRAEGKRDGARTTVPARPSRDTMITLSTLAATATVTGLLNAFLPLVQITKMIRERSAGGLSIPYLMGGLANNAIWNLYALALGNWSLILPMSVGFVMGSSLLTVAIRFQRATRVADDLSMVDTLVLVPAH